MASENLLVPDGLKPDVLLGVQVRYLAGRGRGLGTVIGLDEGMASIRTMSGAVVQRDVSKLQVVEDKAQ